PPYTTLFRSPPACRPPRHDATPAQAARATRQTCADTPAAHATAADDEATAPQGPSPAASSGPGPARPDPPRAPRTPRAPTPARSSPRPATLLRRPENP